MKYLYLLLIITALSACEKDVCSVCTYTLTGVNTSTGETVYDELDTYSEIDEEAGCEMTDEEYESEKRGELQDAVDYRNTLNPVTDINYLTGEVSSWDEEYSFTLNCD